MPISRDQFEMVRRELSGHTSWAIWAPVGEKPKSNVGDLSMFSDESLLEDTLSRLNPNIVLAGLNGSTGDTDVNHLAEPFANFHSSWSRAQDYKIRFATVGTALEGAFMTDVIKHHYETDSAIVLKELRKNPNYEREKVDKFFEEIRLLSSEPKIFAFGSLAFDLINKYNSYGFEVHKLYHYAFTMSKENFREHTISILDAANL